jgi:carbamate kinase
MLGYLLERELRNQLAPEREVATLVTMIRVEADDPAFAAPTKFVGPVYDASRAHVLANEHGWVVKQDGAGWRRVVASPLPRGVVELDAVSRLLDSGSVLICAGGGGVPVIRDPASGHLRGVEAVVDKDHTSAVLALDLGADRFVIVTDVSGVYDGWGTDHARAVATAHPDALEAMTFPHGSMGPKIAAACRFARTGKGDAVIGALDDLPALLVGAAGTVVSTSTEGLTLR